MLKPIDIQNKDFERKLKGYDCDEVDEFLDLVLKDYDMLFRENKYLKEQNLSLKETADRYKLMEVTMRQSLDVAKQSADELRQNATVEAQGIIAKAKLGASRLSKQIDEEHLKKHQEMLSVKSQIESYKSRVRSISENMLKMLDDM